MGVKQPIILKLLTILSLGLLLGFLLYWNIGNYKRERVDLINELNNQMELACGEYKDSLIQGMFEIIELDAEVRTEGSFFSLESDDQRDIIHSSYDTMSKELIQIVPDSGVLRLLHNNVRVFESSTDTAITVLVDANHRDRKIMVWNSDIQATAVKVRYERDTVRGMDFSHGLERDTLEAWIKSSDDFIPLLYAKIDTIFRSRLKARNIDVEHRILLIEEDYIQEKIAIPFEYGGIFSKGEAFAVFYNYSGYIFQGIFSSLLISIGLFTIIAFSFFTIVRSWLNQIQLMAVKDEFVSNMTHELKTPIATVGVAIEALERYGASEDPIKRKEYIDISKHELNRLNILVDKVLKMSTFEQEVDELLMVEVDIQLLVKDVLNSMKLYLEEKEVHLHYKETGLNFNIMGDKIHLTNVVYNLLDNAVKYSPLDPVIEIALREDSEVVLLSVLDNGVGVSKDYQSKVFNRFFRVPSEDRHNVKGHGLGLHYVKTIVERHGGNVKVFDGAVKGSCFAIVIPKRYD
ncbi:MAG: signal transduction histidine kinase [Saprospiraceae bacterium]|jgi:signal transduction histidine kinase